MSVLTHELRFAPAAKKAQTAAIRRSFWARVIDAIIESRTRRAEQELSNHAGLVTDLLTRTCGKNPFGRSIRATPASRADIAPEHPSAATISLSARL